MKKKTPDGPGRRHLNPMVIRRLRWLIGCLLLAIFSGLLAGCPPPPRRALPPAPAHPNVWVPVQQGMAAG